MHRPLMQEPVQGCSSTWHGCQHAVFCSHAAVKRVCVCVFCTSAFRDRAVEKVEASIQEEVGSASDRHRHTDTKRRTFSVTAVHGV